MPEDTKTIVFADEMLLRLCWYGKVTGGSQEDGKTSGCDYPKLTFDKRPTTGGPENRGNCGDQQIDYGDPHPNH